MAAVVLMKFWPDHSNEKGSRDSASLFGCPAWAADESVSVWQCKWVLRNRLNDHAGADEADRNASTYDGTVLKDLDLLQVLTINSLRNSGGLATVTAEVLCLAALNLLVSTTGLQISVKLQHRSAFDSLVFLQRTHGNKAFL